jgi:hypothetical protein
MMVQDHTGKINLDNSFIISFLFSLYLTKFPPIAKITFERLDSVKFNKEGYRS